MSKALFVLELFTFLSWLFGYVEKCLIRKLWLISKFMTSQTGQQIWYDMINLFNFGIKQEHIFL